ncbi:hypothetical protein F6V30_14005 [Oryzomonas sagensis]|uniref:Major capsid protein n=1 Tax=Oryzomonas sagensis TaxID=2603857 RepID=A0ABQ6TKY9_9BACT|nr:DUF5309 family protein [Oryzomonas sagensis]KAB0668947.1 hypothetical protein F6V30_14005 [Oryzomonas sagensis]
MGVPANTVQTTNMVGVRESLLDELSIITPAIAVFYHDLGQGKKPGAKKHEFLTDVIRASADNAQLEGADPTIQASTQPSRLYNFCQIQDESYSVSSTSGAVKIAGRSSERDLQRRKHMEGLSKDINRAFLKSTLVQGDDAATAYKMKGALNWILTNLNMAGDAVLNADGTVTGGTPRLLTAGLIKQTMQNMYTTGSVDKNKTVKGYCNAVQQAQFDNVATAGGNKQRFVEGSKVDDYVDVYVTAFGKVVTELDVEMPVDVLALMNMTYWRKATLETIGETKLATSSALNEKYHITVNHTLEAKNEASSGRITNLDTNVQYT